MQKPPSKTHKGKSASVTGQVIVGRRLLGRDAGHRIPRPASTAPPRSSSLTSQFPQGKPQSKRRKHFTPKHLQRNHERKFPSKKPEKGSAPTNTSHHSPTRHSLI